MSRYQVYLNASGSLEVVDTREVTDYSHFIGRATASWKAIITAGRRRYHSREHDITTRGVFLLTYQDNTVVPVSPSKGDYIPPGYVSVSTELTHFLASYSGRERIKRSKIVPMEGQYIVNQNMVSHYPSFHVNSHRPVDDYMPGWMWIFADHDEGGHRSSFRIVKNHEDLYHVQREGSHALVSQQTFGLEGATRVHVQVRGRPEAVLLDNRRLSLTDDGWVYIGPPLEESPLLSIRVGHEGVGAVNVAHIN